MLHPAHVLPYGETSVGAGLSGQLALRPITSSAKAVSPNVGSFQDLGVAPGVAPWVSGRMGIANSNETGLIYDGRSIRIDARHAFSFGKLTLSTELGVSGIVAHPIGSGRDASGVYGAGADLPVLLGLKSTSDIYSLWFGPRAGFEILGGRLQFGDGTAPSLYDVSARHVYGGLVAGLRVGFRHVHAVIELDANYHWVDGSFKTSGSTGGGSSTNVQQISLTPAGALEISF